MYILIAGGGLVGKGLAKTLTSGKHDVVIIDSNAEVCRELYSSTGAVTVTGSATDLNVLEDAGIDKADVCIGVLDNDSDNISFALLAKFKKIKQVQVQMIDPKYEDVYKSIGIEHIARATELLIDQLIVSIESPDLRKLIGFGELELCIINVPIGSIISDLSVIQFKEVKGIPEDLNITCIYDGDSGELILPNKDTIIKGNDRLFICGTRQNLKLTAKIINK
ncbi:MAG: TrkA family potassium uptake protein [Spirochaetaceae bacterium]